MKVLSHSYKVSKRLLSLSSYFIGTSFVRLHSFICYFIAGQSWLIGSTNPRAQQGIGEGREVHERAGGSEKRESPGEGNRAAGAGRGPTVERGALRALKLGRAS